MLIAAPRARRVVLTLVLLFASPRQGLAHDDPAGPIAELTRMLRAHPGDVSLFLQRGELRRVMGDRAGAGADLAEVEARDPGNPRLPLCRAALALDAGDAAAAGRVLDAVLASRPHDEAALQLRVRARKALGDRRGAIADLSALIDGARPNPDLYLDRARLMMAEGDRHAALAGLDAARARIGRIVSLEHYAADLEMAEGRTESAEARLRALEAAADATPSPPARQTPRSVAQDISVRADVSAPVSAPTAVTAGPATAIPRGAIWRYLATPTDQGAEWRATDYVDTSWAHGPAILGFGESYIVTQVPYGPDPLNKYTTTYFRTAFTIPAPMPSTQYLIMSANYDDGFVAYLNGVEVARRGLPAGPVNYATFATTHEGGAYETIDLSSSVGLLQTGVNVLAVEVHQTTLSSTDLVWDADLVYADVPQVTRGPYLQVGTRTAITVRWRTDVATNSRVLYGTSPGNLNGNLFNSTFVTEHELRLTGLQNATRYYYSVGDLAGPLAGDASYTFVTAPPLGASIPKRIWVVGDSGVPGPGAFAVRDAYATWTGARGTDLWLMLGDNAYTTGLDSEYQTAVFNQYPVLLRQSVLWPTRGNHDFIYSGPGNDYYDIFTMPAAGEAGGLASGSEAYYSFEWGNIHFVCLDSEGSDRTPSGPMLTWLASDLAANTRRWVIAYFHHPPYTKGSHNSDDPLDSGGRMKDMRENALPILEAGCVDLVLTGHSHSYERTYLLDGHYGPSWTLDPSMKLGRGDGRPNGNGPYVKPGGSPYPHSGDVTVVAGSGSKTSGGALNHPAMVASFNLLGSVVLDVVDDRLDARFLNQTGVVLDSFAIVKNGPSTVDVTRAPGDLRLGPGLPNPFTLETHLSYALNRAGRVRLSLHDASGRRVATLVDGLKEAGVHEARWDGRDPAGHVMPSGVYLAVLEADGQRLTRKIARVR